jgi:carbon-monoxide dehydrogenase medium subunit
LLNAADSNGPTMKLPDFDYVAPATAREVVALLASRAGDAKVIAGGQSLLPSMAFRLTRPSLLIDLGGVAGLNGITIDERGVVLGATTRWCDIENDARLAVAHPLLVEAIRHVGHYQIRNRGTVGGGLAHADPAAEMPCIAATCEAELTLLGPGGERRIAAADFFQATLTTALAEDEIIVDVRLPAWPAGRRWAFREFAKRKGDFALAGVAVFYDVDGEQRACNAHIGVLSACYYSRRLRAAEAALNGERVGGETILAVSQIAADEVDPVGDFHASAEYRRALAGTLLDQALNEAASRQS